MKRIGILTSGGDAPGMNACIRAAVRTALANNLAVAGIRRGYTGLIAADAVPLDRAAIRNTIHLGGTILETSRNPDFYTKEGRLRAAAAIERMGLDGVVLIGGDGTFHGASLLAADADTAPLVGVPGSIDNDVYGTDYCIGFDTAANCAVEAIDRIRDTARSHERLFFLEVMGRTAGFLALESGIAGGAEELVVAVRSVEGCFEPFTERGPATASAVSIPAARFVLTPNGPATCNVDVTVRAVAHGTPDPAFGRGGQVTLSQVRTLALTFDR